MELKSRREDAQQESMGILATESQTINADLEKEKRRQQRKEEKRLELEQSFSYRTCKGIKTVMDDYFIDPLLGFIPGIGDFISTPLTLPYLYVALFKVRSLPLVLSVIYNWLIDACVSMIPFVGNFIDFFYKGYKKSYQQIVGYVEDDEEIISEVNGNAVKVAVLIVILAVILYYLYKLATTVWEWVSGWFS